MSYTPPPAERVHAICNAIQYDKDGLIAAIAQAPDGDILMLAWMNKEAVTETLLTGQVCYWSRSRQKLWRKGETSGQRQRLLEARLDCDQDALLVIVEQTGVACHTGRRSCFYHGVTPSGLQDTASPEISPNVLYGTKS